MMGDDTPCQLTAKDVSVLEGMMDRLVDQQRAHSAIARLLRRKLASARIRFRDEIDPRVATINSRVRFAIGSSPAETRVLTHGGENALPGTALPISSVHGLALLGLMEGDTIAVEMSEGRTDVLRIVRIEHQPEAARLRNQCSGFKIVGRPHAQHRLVDAIPEGPEDDDPGPRAA